MMLSALSLFMCAYAAAIFVFVRGVVSYSTELKNRFSYLLFMTPNSMLKIVGSKFLYTFVNGLLFAGIFVALGMLDVGLLLNYMGELDNFLEGLSSLLRMNGVYVDQILLAILFYVLYGFLSIISTVALAYFAITLSRTLLRDRKWRWLPSIGLFVLLYWLISWVNGLFPDPTQSMMMVESVQTVEEEMQVISATMGDIVRYLIPSALVSVAVILGSLFACAGLLKKKVSL